MHNKRGGWPALALAAALAPLAAPAQDKPVYRCPGSPVLYTDARSRAATKQALISLVKLAMERLRAR